MRFLLGLIIGAAMTLGAADFLEGHSDKLVSEARSLWNDLRSEADELVEARGDPLPEGIADQWDSIIDELPAIETAPTADLEPVPFLASEPAIPTLDSLKLSDVNRPIDDGHILDEDILDPQSGTASVWTAFHSERSANGFAEVLTRETGHAFSIDRRGPGEYQVMFAYADDSERAALLGLIAGVTGSN